MDNNQDKYTNYHYNGDSNNNVSNNYYNQPQNGYNQPVYSQPQNGYNQPNYSQPQNGYNQPNYSQPQNGYNQPVYSQPQNGYNQPVYSQPQNGYNQPAYSQNPYYGQPQGYNNTYTAPVNKRARIDGFCISSLICGITSIPLGFCYGFGIVFSIVGIIMRNVYRKKHNYTDNGMSRAGLITSIVGLAMAALFFFLVFIIVLDELLK